jgi:hypothetical protein
LPDSRAAADARAARARPERSRLVVSVVIDQLGSATLSKLEPLLAADGLLAHARRHGVVYEQVVYPFAATLTAPGHAAIYSGAPPARTAITTNYLIDPVSGRRRAIVDDGTHAVHGVPGKFAGPGAMRAETVADVLTRETHGSGKVASLSIKDRSAILPAGKRPDLVLWFDGSLRAFTTSAYYAPAPPAWLAEYQRAHPVAAERVVWTPADPAALAARLGPDAAEGEAAYKGLDTSFPHELAASSDPYDTWVLAPASTDALLALALEAVAQLGLGQDDTPDLLAISISGTDYAGHVFGPDSWEYADHLRHADRVLLQLLQRLQAQTSVALLVTSDHGVAPLPEQAKRAHPAAARLDTAALAPAVDQAVDAAVGPGDWIAGYVDSYLYLTPAARSHPAHARVREAAVEALRATPGIVVAHDITSDGASLPPALRDAVLRTVHPETSGDIFVVTAEYVVPELGMTPRAGTTHGSPWPYDSHVPVLLVAPGLARARHAQPLELASVASTLAALLGVPWEPSGPAVPPLPGVAGR